MGIVVAIGYAFRWSSGGVRLQPLAFCWVVQVLRSLWFRTCITFFVSDLLFALNSWNACILSCVLFIPALTWLPESHTGLFSRHGSPLDLYVLWRSKKQVKILCPTRFVVDATENSKEGGVVAEVYSSQTGLWTKLKKATYYCSYLGQQNKVTFIGGISERRSTKPTHQSPKNQCKAMRASAKPLQGG